MNKEYALGYVDVTINFGEEKSNIAKHPSIYNTALHFLEQMRESIFCGEIAPKEQNCAVSLDLYNSREFSNYDDKLYSKRLGECSHVYDVYFGLLDNDFVKIFHKDAIKELDKACSIVKISQAESEYNPVYQPMLNLLKEMRNLLLQEKWPDKNFTVTVDLLAYLKEHNNQFNEEIISSINEAVKQFDSYFDFLDPSYRAE
jgi:hypothetical protein